MRLVLQRTSTDCALACVAMVSGRPYREVFQVAVEQLGYQPGGPHLTTITNLRRLLAEFDIHASGLRTFRGFDLLGDKSILLVNYAPPTTSGHWIVYERRHSGARILNPSRRVKYPIHTQFKRLKVAYVVELETQLKVGA